MNLKELVGDEGLQQDSWSLNKPAFGESGQITVVGWSGKRGKASNKLYIVKCDRCSQDCDLFGEGYFRCEKSSLTKGKVPCGCSSIRRWSKEQFYIRCSREAKELGYTFLGFVGEWKGAYTRIKILCEKHGEWDTGSVNTVNSGQGCPACRDELVSMLRTKPDDVMVASFFSSGAFHPETKFWRSDSKDGRGARIYWYMSCPECGEIGEAASNNLQQGQKPCACCKHRQLQTYINLIVDVNSNTLVAIKFGVAKDSVKRTKQQNLKSSYEVSNHQTYEFPTVQQCKKAERECKMELERGVVLKRDMPDGYTETTWAYNLEKIIEIYERNGGILKQKA